MTVDNVFLRAIEAAQAKFDAVTDAANSHPIDVADGVEDQEAITSGNDLMTNSEAAVEQSEDPDAILTVNDNVSDFETAAEDEDRSEEVDNNQGFVPRTFVQNVGAGSEYQEEQPQAKKRCPHYNVGYCRFRDSCRNEHPKVDCTDVTCFGKRGDCMKRHRVICEKNKKGKCAFGPRCEFFHDGQDGISRSKRQPRQPRQPKQVRRKAKIEDRRRQSTDNESNISGDNESNASYNESNRTNASRLNSSKIEEKERARMRNWVRDLQYKVNDELAKFKQLEGKVNETVDKTTEKVKKVAIDLKVIENKTAQGIGSLRNELAKTTKGIKALEKELDGLRKDCKRNHSNQEDKLKEIKYVIVKDSTHLSLDDEEDVSELNESTLPDATRVTNVVS